MAVTKITDENIVDVDASKLVGSFGNVDGSNLTNVPLGKSITKTTSDPTQETNPADGVGALHLNTSNGELFCCVDATTDFNVWKNTGLGTTETIQPVSTFQGTQYGFVAGGQLSDNNESETIDKFSFSNEANTADHGDLAQGRHATNGFASSTHGIVVGGRWSSSPGGWPPVNTIEKYDFSNTNGATNVGNMAEGIGYHQANQTENYGYVVGGYVTVTKIEKYSFATDTHTGTVGNMLMGRRGASNANSYTHGYNSNGYNDNQSHAWLQEIEKFSFASEGTSTNVGNSTRQSSHGGAWSSYTHGYSSGGFDGGGNIIDKFSFSSDNDATDVGDIAIVVTQICGQTNSSITDGYIPGASTTGGGGSCVTTIQKHSFATGGGTTSVGNITLARRLGTSHNL